MKKTLSLVLTLMLIFAAVPMAGAEGECAHENFVWIYEGADDDYNCVSEEGVRYKECSSCSEVLSEKEIVPLQPSHRWLESGRDEAKCERPDNSADIPYIYYECIICDSTMKKEQSYSGHSWSDWKVIVKCFEGSNPFENGVYERECENCGETETAEVKDHTYIVMEGSAPTCFKEGMTDYKRCLVCGTVAPNQPIEKLSHIDENADGNCDICDALLIEGGEACRCICHSKMGIVQNFILPIVQFIWNLLGMNTCGCGAAH